MNWHRRRNELEIKGVNKLCYFGISVHTVLLHTATYKGHLKS
jgi:hypothetical protein